MNIRKRLKLLILICLSFYLYSCHQEEIYISDKQKKRIVLVYMVADNNLDYFAVQDINEMEAGFPKDSDDKLLVYIDRGRNGNPSHPYLMEIVHDTSDLIVSKILLTYPEHNATEKNVFEEVLNDAFSYFSDENFTSKGLVLWSHGNAWLPSGISILTNRDKLLEDTTKSFGLDNVPEEANMDIKELAQVLENYHFNFLLFDACFMSSIEVIYELRNTTDYMIAAPTEVLSNGFPYQNVVPLFFQENLNVDEIAEKYFEYYNNKGGLLKSASISVIKMDEVRNLTQKIYNFFTALSSKDMKIAEKDSVLELDRLDGEWIYDLQDLLEKTAQKNDLNTEYKNIISQWNNTVIYENNTPFMVENIDLENCNGISTYIPDVIHKNEVNEYYKTLLWFKASGYDKVFTNF